MLAQYSAEEAKLNAAIEKTPDAVGLYSRRGDARMFLARFPEALNGHTGRAAKLIALLDSGDLRKASREFYNSLEAPALDKHPWLAVLQDFLRENGAAAVLMSGSGSTTFAIAADLCAAQELEERVHEKFGRCWTAVVASK
jgi:4-diphosphocytidyl-2-C-methyl-D-erythritol kinase